MYEKDKPELFIKRIRNKRTENFILNRRSSSNKRNSKLTIRKILSKRSNNKELEQSGTIYNPKVK